jgi:hypothetical protein
LYVIDGVMTKNPATFLNLKPKEVFTIKIIKQSNKLVRFGALGANGVILIHTKNAGRDTRMQKDDTFLLTGMSPRLKSATASVPGIGDPARPIMKPCLLWAPHVLLDASGKAVVRFNTSDDVGKFKIEVEGMTAQGKPFFAEETIRVQYNP